MIENIGEVIYRVDAHTKQFTFVSHQVKSILGYTPAEFLNIMNDYLRSPFYHEKDRKWVVAGRYDFLVKCLNEGMQVPHDAEYRAKHKNGDVLWVVETIYPSYSPDGIIEAFVGKIVDITEHKHGEQKLREQAQTLEQVHDIVICTDLDGYVLSWNRGAERVYGYSAEEAPGKHMSFMYQEEQGKNKNSFHQQVAKPLLEKVRSHRSLAGVPLSSLPCPCAIVDPETQAEVTSQTASWRELPPRSYRHCKPFSQAAPAMS